MSHMPLKCHKTSAMALASCVNSGVFFGEAVVVSSVAEQGMVKARSRSWRWHLQREGHHREVKFKAAQSYLFSVQLDD
jgi:hypothetical protein